MTIKSPTAEQIVAIGLALLLAQREGAAMPGRVCYVPRKIDPRTPSRVALRPTPKRPSNG